MSKVICINDKKQQAAQLVSPVVEGELYTVIDEFICCCGCGDKLYTLQESWWNAGFEPLRFEPYTTDFLEEIQEHLQETETNRVTILKEY